MSAREYDYPVWGTRDGGLVRKVSGTYIFVAKPDCPGLDVGDEMPQEWGIAPANYLAGEVEAAGIEFEDPASYFDHRFD